MKLIPRVFTARGRFCSAFEALKEATGAAIEAEAIYNGLRRLQAPAPRPAVASAAAPAAAVVARPSLGRVASLAEIPDLPAIAGAVPSGRQLGKGASGTVYELA